MYSLYKSIKTIFIILSSAMLLQACNKEYDEIDPTPPGVEKPKPTGTVTLNELINTDTSFSFLKAAVAKAGLGSVLSNTSLHLTLFAPDNDAFRRSFQAMGLPPVIQVLDQLDVETVRSIVSYHLTPEYLPAESIPTTFPNLQYPTYLNPAPQISPLLRLTIFPSRSANGAYVNNIPITAINTEASNGVLHRVAAIVAPPSKAMFELVAADTSLSFLVAAMERADSGRTTIAEGSLIEATKSIGANLTLFAPTNNAFRTLLSRMGLPPSAVVFAALPVNTVRGLVAYHLLGSRAFSVNMPTTPTFIKTLLNSSLPPAHPGINVAVGFTGPFVTTFQVTGVGNNSIPARVIAQDLHAFNGVIHKIDQVLLPQ
jgi:uncharacterized surface protein with fasciclin (FAS1) repeats